MKLLCWLLDHKSALRQIGPYDYQSYCSRGCTGKWRAPLPIILKVRTDSLRCAIIQRLRPLMEYMTRRKS